MFSVLLFIYLFIYIKKIPTRYWFLWLLNSAIFFSIGAWSLTCLSEASELFPWCCLPGFVKEAILPKEKKEQALLLSISSCISSRLLGQWHILSPGDCTSLLCWAVQIRAVPVLNVVGQQVMCSQIVLTPWAFSLTGRRHPFWQLLIWQI